MNPVGRTRARVQDAVGFQDKPTETGGLDRIVQLGRVSAFRQPQAGRFFPKLGAMRKATLMAIGVDYQDRTYVLREGDEVSLFPPVQGG